MPKATVGANARAIFDRQTAEETKAVAIVRRMTERYLDPEMLKGGLEIIARMQRQNDLAKSITAEFDAALKEENAIARDNGTTDEELDAAVARSRAVADRILALPGAGHVPTIRLKARVYLWAEEESLESLSKEATATSDRALISLLRDLGVDRPIASEMGKTEVAR